MRLKRPKFTRPRLVAMLAASAASGYAALVRPRLVGWGATDEEAAMPLPGDEIVPQPHYMANHAIRIEAPPAVVWAWLIQIGQGRGGFYSYDWLENLLGLGIHSSDEIVPEFQTLKPGDHVRLAPESERADLHYEVVSVEPEKALVLKTSGTLEENIAHRMPFGTWVFVLLKEGDGATRLLARTRNSFGRGMGNALINKYGLEPVHFLMERRMLLGIKKRAESSVTPGGGLGEMVAGIEATQAAA